MFGIEIFFLCCLRVLLDMLNVKRLATKEKLGMERRNRDYLK